MEKFVVKVCCHALYNRSMLFCPAGNSESRDFAQSTQFDSVVIDRSHGSFKTFAVLASTFRAPPVSSKQVSVSTGGSGRPLPSGRLSLPT